MRLYLTQGGNERRDLFNIFSVIGQARYFVLAAELAFAFQPGGEYAFVEGVEQGGAEGDILMPLGLVVAVDALQCLVELVGELFQAGRLFFKFYQPFVSAIALIAEIDGRCRIIIDYRTGVPAGDGDGLVGVVDDDLFTKGVDKMF